MPTLTIEYTTEAERLQYERLVAYVQEMMHWDSPHLTAPFWMHAKRSP
jgi:hypothetical protein